VRLPGVAAALLLTAATAAAQPAREQALTDLGRTEDVAARRSAAQRLADSGVMTDLPALAHALRDPDPLVRALTESAMWAVWSRSGDADVDRLLALGVEQMTQRALAAAADTFTDVIQRRPQFAEGWNKRATVYYLMGEYQKSLADCDEVMTRNPYHWGALSGYGMIYIQLDQPDRALGYLEKALAVNPNLQSVAQTIETLKALLMKRRRDMI
jgi:tetratricopeptide (TPR) repeat protein